MPRLIAHTLLLFLLAGSLALPARGAAPVNRGGLALQAGIWKPSSLDDQPSKPFAAVDGSGLSWGGSYFTPQLAGFTLRLSGWQWQQADFAAGLPLERIVLRHLALDLKYQLLGAVPIRPYVAYGGALIFAREHSAAPHAGDPAFARLGFALNVGAGVDFILMRHWGFSAEYQYLYADMERNVGLTSHYSGPKLTFKLLFLF